MIVFLTTENIPKNCGKEKCISVAHNIPPIVIAIEGTWMNICHPPPATMAPLTTMKPKTTPIIVATSIKLLFLDYLL
jgi:hypothetical protein